MAAEGLVHRNWLANLNWTPRCHRA